MPVIARNAPDPGGLTTLGDMARAQLDTDSKLPYSATPSFS